MKTIYFPIKQRFLSPFLILIFSALISSCGSAGGEIQSYDDLNRLVETRNFEIQNEWAMPLGGNRINLIGNTNFIRFKGDSVDLFLPYFGVRHSGGDYGGDGGIEFEGIAEDLEINKNAEKNKIVIEFEGEDDNNENLDFHITLFSNGNTNTSVNSSQRTSISYQGTVEKLKEEQE